MEKQKPSLKLLAFLVVFIAAGVLITIGALRVNGANPENRVAQVAGRLGLSTPAEIARVERCWDTFAHCGTFFYFSTPQTSEAFGQLVRALDWETLNDKEVDGYNIFTEINMNTNARLTIDGQDALGDRLQLPPIQARQWQLLSPEGSQWIVTFYALAAQGGKTALNGAPLSENIISILHQTK